MKYYRIFIAAALGISLIMNYTLFSRLTQIENQVSGISSYQSQIMSTVSGQTGHIENVMNDIRREQSWISAISMDVDTSDAESGQAEASFEWQIKELPDGADVEFNYSFGESDSYTSISAEELETGLFQVRIPFEVDMQPQWEIMGYIEQEVSEKIIEEQRIAEENEETKLDYFVSMSHNETVKSSAEQTAHLGHFGSSYYGMILTDLSIHEEDFFVNIISEYPEAQYSIEEVNLMIYQEDELTEEIMLVTEDQNRPRDYYPVHFRTEEPLKTDSFTRLVAQVIYNNGETFEKEIYQK